MSGLVCAFAGILLTAQNSSVSYNAGYGLELNVVAIVLFGGVSIFGGRGTVLGVVLLTTHRKPAIANSALPLDPYAANLILSDVAMSESSSLSGGKVTYIDGHMRNTGSRTVTAAELQVLFSNDLQMPPQIEPVPLTLIRTREPYIDTQPPSAAPLQPGDTREFRLAFEDITQNWNQQIPEIRVVHVATK